MLIDQPCREAIETRCSRIVEGYRVPTLKTEISSICTLEVEAGTNGECGGDSGHGSRTYIRLKDLSSFDIQAKTSASGKEIEITIGGDFELQDIQSALLFAAGAIKTLQVEAELRRVFAREFSGYYLTTDDEEMLRYTAAKSSIDPRHFSAWLKTCTGMGWRFIAVGGAHLLIESYDDEFTIFPPGKRLL